MKQCSKEAFNRCQDRDKCGWPAYFADGSECDRFNDEVGLDIRAGVDPGNAVRATVVLKACVGDKVLFHGKMWVVKAVQFFISNSLQRMAYIIENEREACMVVSANDFERMELEGA